MGILVTRGARIGIASVLLLLSCGAAGFGYLRTPPELARLLPESDGIVYANLVPLRALTHPNAAATQREAGYQRFIDATGIIAERDLDAVAMALHRMPDPRGPNGPVGYSEVLRGRFDRDRLERYLGQLASSRELYAEHTIYLVPSEGRTVRLAILDRETVAASNLPTPEQIHGMIDRSAAGVGHFPESALLSRHFSDVPPLASAWGLGELALPFVDANAPSGPIQAMGFALPERGESFFIASVRFTGAPHLHVEQIAATDRDAERLAQNLTALLDLYRGFQATARERHPAPDEAAVKEITDSIHIEAASNRVIVDGVLPASALRRVAAAAPPDRR